MGYNNNIHSMKSLPIHVYILPALKKRLKPDCLTNKQKLVMICCFSKICLITLSSTVHKTTDYKHLSAKKNY